MARVFIITFLLLVTAPISAASEVSASDAASREYVEGVVSEVEWEFPAWTKTLLSRDLISRRRGIDRHLNPHENTLQPSSNSGRGGRVIRLGLIMGVCTYAVNTSSNSMVQMAAYCAGLVATGLDFYIPTLYNSYLHFRTPSRVHLAAVANILDRHREDWIESTPLLTPPQRFAVLKENVLDRITVLSKQFHQLYESMQRTPELSEENLAFLTGLYLKAWVLGAILYEEYSFSVRAEGVNPANLLGFDFSQNGFSWLSGCRNQVADEADKYNYKANALPPIIDLREPAQ